MKDRVVNIRLLNGSFLLRGGKRAEFSAADARTFLNVMHARRSDPLWGASLEWLPKRGAHSPMDKGTFERFLAKSRAAMLIRHMTDLERQAREYERQAAAATDLAQRARVEANAILASIPVLRENDGHCRCLGVHTCGRVS